LLLYAPEQWTSSGFSIVFNPLQCIQYINDFPEAQNLHTPWSARRNHQSNLTRHLARSANLPEKNAGKAIYFACGNFFFFSFFYYEQSYLSIYWADFHNLSPNGSYLRHFLDQVQFFRFLKGRCYGNQFCVVSKTQTTCDFCNFYTV